jgi:hypothetical protein
VSALAVDVLPAGEPLTDAQLDAFFETCPTSVAQQTVGWRDVIAATGRDEPVFLGCRRAGRLVGVLPAYRYEGPLGAILTSVPQAGPLGGIACAPETDPEPIYGALVRSFLEVAAARGCALATLITNPFWPDRTLYERQRRPDYVLENVCQVLDLGGALDGEGQPLAGSEHLQRNLRKARAARLVVDDLQTAASVSDLYAIHVERHGEIGATPLPEELFAGALAHMVPRDKARFFFVRVAESGAMVGGGFYLHHQAVVDALMPAVRHDAAQQGANYLLALHSIRWAAARGLRFYNWQGSPPDGGVYRFKRQWGSRDVPYAFLTWITGDETPFVRSTVDAVRRSYAWHYVLPYDRIGAENGVRGGVSSRADAWRALPGEPAFKDGVVAHYEAQLARHGATAQGMDWKDDASQRLRFAVLTEVCALDGKRVHEVGAGAGHLRDFLSARGTACVYSGSDRSEAMVRVARARHPDVSFARADAAGPLPGAPWDVVLASGVFHVKLDTSEAAWAEFVRTSIEQMWAASTEAIAFNLMSDRVDYRAPQLWYASAADVLAFCRSALSRWVVLREDYPLHEFTVYVYRRPPRDGRP